MGRDNRDPRPPSLSGAAWLESERTQAVLGALRRGNFEARVVGGVHHLDAGRAGHLRPVCDVLPHVRVQQAGLVEGAVHESHVCPDPFVGGTPRGVHGVNCR